MHKLISIFVVFAVFCSAYAQTSDKTKGCAPLEIKFNSSSAGQTHYWDFKDGVVSVQPSPSHIFTKPGTYKVSYQANPVGPVIATIEIKVLESPALSIKPVLGCSPFNAELVSNSKIDPEIKVNRYVWVFGDGQSSETTLPQTTHTYFATGSYEVSLGIKTDLPSCDKNQVIEKGAEVINGPASFFLTTPNQSIFCADSVIISFTNTSTSPNSNTLAYAWELGSTKKSTDKDPAKQLFKTGTHTITLKSSFKELPQCVSSYSRSIFVGKPEAKIIASQKDTVCAGVDMVTMSINYPGSIVWSFTDGIEIRKQVRDTVIAVFQKKGLGEIKAVLTDPTGSCTNTVSKKVYADKIEPVLNATPTFTCQKEITVQYEALPKDSKFQYLWRFDDTIKRDSLINTTSYSYKSSNKGEFGKNGYTGIFGIVGIKSTVTGCVFAIGRADTLWRPDAAIRPLSETKGCAPLTVMFKDTSDSAPKDSILKREWHFGDGQTTTKVKKQNVSHQFVKPGEYKAFLIVTTKGGCKDTSYSIDVNVGDILPDKFDFSANKTNVCQEEEVILSVNKDSPLIDAYHFSSSDTKFYHCENEKSVRVKFFNSAGPQDVSLMVDYNGCTTEAVRSNYINVKGPLAKIDYYAVCSDPYNYHFNSLSKNTENVSWELGDGTSSANLKQDQLYTSSGDYTVILTSSNSSGCLASKDTVLVHPRKIKAAIVLDPTTCTNTFHSFSASGSVDVYDEDHSGYSWFLPTLDSVPHKTSSRNVSYNLIKRGKHTVMLEVEDINGCKDTATATFKIHGIDMAYMSNKDRICLPQTLQFRDESKGDTTLVSWKWKFTELDSSFAQHPSVKYTIPPLPKGKLTISDKLGCEDTTSVLISMYKPFSFISLVDPTLCIGDTAYFNASDFTTEGSSLQYKWDFGNGEKGNQSKDTIYYPQDSTYRVKLIYTENVTNCTDSTLYFVSVHNYPVAGITTNVDTIPVLCSPQNVTFQDSSVSKHPLLHSWNFGNGQQSSQPNFTLSYRKGAYQATHIVSTYNGCSDTTSQRFKVESPEGDFTMSKFQICKGDSISFALRDTVDVGSYAWDFGDGTTLNNKAPIVHPYRFHPPLGQTEAKLILRGKGGICPVAKSKIVRIHQVIADFGRGNGSDTTSCIKSGPFPFTNRSKGHDFFEWQFGDGTKGRESNPLHSYAAPGSYKVQMYVANKVVGCKDSITKLAIVYPNPVVKAVGDTACLGKAANLYITTPNSAHNYVWLPITGLDNPISTTPEALISQSQKYKVTEYDRNGCTDTMSVWANIISPLPIKDWDTSIVIGDMVTIPVYKTSFYSFYWQPSTGLSCLDCNYPTAKPLADMVYKLNVTDVKGCFNTNHQFNVIVKPETFIKMPSAFTPNGDGSNDILSVKGWGIKELLSFQIFNRWGEMIYENTNLEEGWDGKFKGVSQNSDVYVYKVKVKTWREVELYTEGQVNLFY